MSGRPYAFSSFEFAFAKKPRQVFEKLSRLGISRCLQVLPSPPLLLPASPRCMTASLHRRTDAVNSPLSVRPRLSARCIMRSTCRLHLTYHMRCPTPLRRERQVNDSKQSGWHALRLLALFLHGRQVLQQRPMLERFELPRIQGS
jgi:hypothetical protein